MNSPRRHRLWWTAGGLGVLLFVWVVAAECVWTAPRRTQDWMMSNGPNGFDGHYGTTRGWPVVWSRSVQHFDLLLKPGGRQHWFFGPVEPVGWNPAVPAVAVLTAACLPLVAVGRLARGGRPAGRVERLARTGLVSGLAGWAVAAAELETAADARQFGHYPPNWFLDRWADRFGPRQTGGPAPGYRIEFAPGYREALKRAQIARGRVFGDAGNAKPWHQRTVLVSWAVLCSGGAAAVWWKPWRAAPTTPPPA